jgi:hypothetical protein
MAARYYQRVAGMKLPEIQERERLRVLKDEAGGMKACHDPAEGTGATGARVRGSRHDDAFSSQAA